MSEFNTIDEILEDLRRGKMAVIMDDEDRENEGDLVMAASCVRAEDVNFMARYGRGLICLTLTRDWCRQLRLPLMVSDTDSLHKTNFTVSIEAAEGVTTGISAHDRAHTVQTAVAAGAQPEDLRQPGHIFPLRGTYGGGLRSGTPRGFLAGGDDRRNSQRRWHDGAPARSATLCRNSSLEDRDDRGSDPLSLEERAIRGAHL